MDAGQMLYHSVVSPGLLNILPKGLERWLGGSERSLLLQRSNQVQFLGLMW